MAGPAAGSTMFRKLCVERIFATYLIETPFAVEKAAASLAGEQSSGTFVDGAG